MKKLCFFLAFCLLLAGAGAQQWKAVPLVSKDILSRGHSGGEGCQVVQAIEADHTDGSFLLMGTDVGGIYRSIDGGKHWAPCNIGYSPRGNCGFAIDPNNPERALAVGANSTTNSTHGLYLTTNRGGSWKQVVTQGAYAGQGLRKDKVAFAKSSFDSAAGYSMLAYCSAPIGGIYRSLNGGANWTRVNISFSNCVLKVDPLSGVVYLLAGDGFYTSTDSAKTFVKKLTGVFTEMDVLVTRPGWVYVSAADKLFRSQDGGENFVQISGSGYPKNVVTLAVSPAKPDYMIVCHKENDWGGPMYYSSNGGTSWALANLNNQDAFMPYNTRTQQFTWHPTDSSRVWALGGDWISSSSNGGKNFRWDANGYNGILVGGFFNFNLAKPGLLFVASQDYNGAFTADTGRSWVYCNPSHQGWGGFTYGAYAASEKVLLTQNCPGWGVDGYLTISRDGGKSFVETGLLCTGLDVGFGDPSDSSILFFSNYRSSDFGLNWNKMTACKGVFCANPFGKQELFGANGQALVTSTDHGLSWSTLRSMPAGIRDMAYDHRYNRLYIVTDGDRLFKLENATLTELSSKISLDQFNNRAVRSVVVDMQDPDRVYVAGAKDIYKTDATVKRSIDGGESWEIYNPNNRTNDGAAMGDGVNEAFALRVHPYSRELWAAGGCYGIWKDANTSLNCISLSSPRPFTGYSGSDSIFIECSTDRKGDSITRIEFMVGDSLLATDSIAPYQYSWKQAPEGNHILYARAVETSGKILFAPPVNVHRYASLPPSVQLSFPTSDSLLPENTIISLESLSADPDGEVTQVEYFANGVSLGKSAIPPFSVSWDKPIRGVYNLSCKVTDNSGESAVSPVVRATVFGAQGKVNYYEDFDDGLAQKWKVLSGSWGVNNYQYSNTAANGAYRCIYDGSSFSGFSFSANVKGDWGNLVGLIFNFQDATNYYQLLIDTDPLTATLKRVLNGVESTIKTSSFTGGGVGQYMPVIIANKGGFTSVVISGKTVFTPVPTPDFKDGKIGFYTYYNPAYFDNVEVIADAHLFTAIEPLVKLPDAGIKISRLPVAEISYLILLPQEEKEVHYRLFDLLGQELHSGSLQQVKEFQLNNLQEYAARVLLLQVSTGKAQQCLKIVTR